MTLDPDAAAWLDALRASGAPPVGTVPPERLRALHDAGAAAAAGEPEPVEEVHDADADGVPVRVHVPEGARGTTVYLHGGGWVVGTLDSYEHVCRALARSSGSTVVSVGYDLSPEVRHPHAVLQCERALAWAASRHGGPVRLAGDSAGGHLACLVAARTHVALEALALVYPVVSPALDTPSARENATGYGLGTEGMRWYWEQYLPAAPTDVPVDLLDADLAVLPRTLVLTAGFDPLRDEGLVLADALEQRGVPVTRLAYDGQVHGFVRTSGPIPTGVRAQHEVGRWLAAPDGHLPRHALVSDVDGVRHLVVLEDLDLQGQALRLRDDRGRTRDAPFRRQLVFGAGTPNLLGYGEGVERWLAVCDHGGRPQQVVPQVR